jgi:hypothetical protein
MIDAEDGRSEADIEKFEHFWEFALPLPQPQPQLMGDTRQIIHIRTSLLTGKLDVWMDDIGDRLPTRCISTSQWRASHNHRQTIIGIRTETAKILTLG